MELTDTLLGLVATRAPEPAATWLRTTLAKLTAASFGPAFASAARRFGHAELRLSAAEHAEVAALSAASGALGTTLEVTPLSGLVRCLLLLGAVRVTAVDERVGFVVKVFDTADNFERSAVLRSLAWLPDPERFVDLAIRSCRTHVQDVFEAIACENPYAARYFPDPAFHQVVLKCFFNEVQVRRIDGLEARRNPELTRMALGYASERTAAGRSVPSDLDLVTGIAASDAGSHLS